MFATAAPARAQDDGLPVQLTVTVVPPSAARPRPTGRVIVSVDDRELLSLALVRGIAALTSLTPQLSVVLEALGHRVAISYSGDSNYEASDGISVTLPTRNLLTIVARPKDTAAPAIEIRSPGDGARYRRGEAVAASYSCRDPGGRSDVTTCDGPVASGGALDTTSAGTFSFAVRSEDALGNAGSKTVTYEVTADTGAPASTAPGGVTGSGGGSGDPAAAPAPPPGTSSAPTTDPGAAPPARGLPGAGLPAGGVPGAGLPPGGSPAGPQSATRSSALRPRTQPQGSSSPGSAAAGQRQGAPNAGSSGSVTARPVRQELAPLDPRSDPAKTIGILVAAFTLLQLGASTGGLALALGAGGVVRSTARADPGVERPRESRQLKPGSGYERLRIKFLGAGLGTVAVGDRSRTWTWPGTQTIDAVGASLPVRLARRSPLLARVAADGTYLRAILGSASLLAPIAGVALGVAAVQDTGGDALVPVVALTIAIAVLGVLDAAAGLVAVLIFTTGVLMLGGLDSSADARLMLSLAALWFVVPVLAGAARPLRRAPTRGLGESWGRAADFVIASLVGAWAVHKIVLAQPGLAGMQLPSAEHADSVAFCVLAALVVRLAAETIAAHLYPRRLDITEAGAVPAPGALQRLAASAVRTSLFVFFGYIVAGGGWQLWVAAALFVAPQILLVYKERFPNSPALFRARPRGLLRIVLTLFFATAIGALLLRTMDERSETFLADSFMILALPGCLLALLPVFGREGDEPTTGWGKRIAASRSSWPASSSRSGSCCDRRAAATAMIRCPWISASTSPAGASRSS